MDAICGNDGCRWLDFSAPGNIMYGYLSAARGVEQGISWIAGGYLESKDNKKINLCYWKTFFDNPGDKAAALIRAIKLQ